VRAQQGFFLIERTCPTCGGAGRVIRNPAASARAPAPCSASGTLQVAIPAGVEDGTRIRLSGEGEAGGQGAPNGDLYVHVAIRRIRSSSATAPIFMRVPLRMTQAALGGEVEVPVIDGTKAKVKDPGRHADRRAVPPARQGLLGAAQRRARRHVHPGRGGDAAAPDAAKQRELLEEFEAEAEQHAQGQPGPDEGFFAKVSGLARSHQGQRSTAQFWRGTLCVRKAAMGEHRSKPGDTDCERRPNIPHIAVIPPSTNSRAPVT
jgi:molecular chaperone DnaJ